MNISVLHEDLLVWLCFLLSVYVRILLSRVCALSRIDAVSFGEGDIGTMCLHLSMKPGEYSYFSPRTLSMWAGPEHWRFKPRHKCMYVFRDWIYMLLPGCGSVGKWAICEWGATGESLAEGCKDNRGWSISLQRKG